ncbi:pro-sigmaK processing inhibitor BofA family protein [Oscillospiraceae bacterium NSJ-54]|uniref:Pro-sigmaK processing inhibitor BofA family protein n=1 Tax=Zongyangia hominis TaxID=2763677 RepID=A0A926EA79_9FIRM|nr:pro-sigmaK processing inhibitor BofA family protein [Zongyangia hominis]
MVALYAKRTNPVSTYVTHALCGFLGLAAVNLTTGYTGIVMGVNLFTCLVTALLGLPGVATMSALHFIWAIG